MKNNSVILFISILFLRFKNIIPNDISQIYYGAGPIRSMTLVSNGRIIGGRSTGHSIEVWGSTNKGSNWSIIGTIASNSEVNYGDIMLLAIPNVPIVYAAFREENSLHQFKITICRSDNGGDDWTYDSTVIDWQNLFVGAPWLFLAQNGDMQCYYDSEVLASNNGSPGNQWIAMQGRDGIRGEWNKYSIVTVSRDTNIYKVCRDGMASVIDLGNNRIMVVTEGVEDQENGGARANVIRAIQSFNGGKTWDFNERRIVYQSRIHQNSNKRFNAYVPMGIRIGNGPVGVVFCTDEDFDYPDASYEPIPDRNCHVKFIRTLENFETWGDLQTFWSNGNIAYAPGMIEIKLNEVLVSIDNLGIQTFLKYK